MVSIIVPNFNHEAFLRKRLQSIVNQNFEDYELILLDDASTDNSRIIIEEYSAHPKVSNVILNSHNSGNPFSQWIKGIQASSGEFIWIAESDDWSEPSFLEAVVPALVRDPDCVISYSQSYCMRDDNQIQWLSFEPLLESQIDGYEFVRQKMLHTNSVFNASMVVFRKSAFKKVSHHFTQYNFCGDWLLWIELAMMGSVCISGRTLNYFRRELGNHSSLSYQGDKCWEELRIFKSLYQRNLIDKAGFIKGINNSYLRFLQMKGNISDLTRLELEKTYQDTANGFFNLKKSAIKQLLQTSFTRMFNFAIRTIG